MSLGGEPIVRLRHGTTRQRAESILLNGPNPRFMEPGGLDPARGFSTDRADKPYVYPSPEDYAAKKALNFPNEGGAAIVEVEVPESIVQKADVIVEVRFDFGYGLDELLVAWPSLSKRILLP